VPSSLQPATPPKIQTAKDGQKRLRIRYREKPSCERSEKTASALGRCILAAHHVRDMGGLMFRYATPTAELIIPAGPPPLVRRGKPSVLRFDIGAVPKSRLNPSMHCGAAHLRWLGLEHRIHVGRFRQIMASDLVQRATGLGMASADRSSEAALGHH
jgi:hypothetical protein